jgi:excisionase family DNA binding protein
LERERVTVQEAASRLGITESAVRKRASRGHISSEKVTEGKRERLYIYLDPEVDIVQEPFRERYMRSLEDRVRTLEDEVMRQQAIILSMSQSMQALTAGPESPEPRSSEARPTPTETAGEPTEPSSRPWWRRMFGG